MSEPAALLEVRGCELRRSGRLIIAGLSFAVAPGDWLALLGANGAGKSTLLAALAGRLTVDAGQVSVAGADLVRQRNLALAKVGFAVPPEQLPDALTGLQCLQLTAAARGRSAPDDGVLQLAEALQLRALGLPVRHYSQGMRQKLAVLLALVAAPPVLLLDEVFSGLDLQSARVLGAALRAHTDARGAVVLASHDLDLVRRCASRMLLLADGRAVMALAGADFSRACAAGLEQTMIRYLENQP